MSNIAYTPLNAPQTVTKPGRVLICLNGECKLRLNFGLYFDGTNNNLYEDAATLSHSNVARLYKAAYDEPINSLHALYIPGVGTPFPQIGEIMPHKDGASMGAMGAERIRYALLMIVNRICQVLQGREMVPPAGIPNAVETDDNYLRWNHRLSALIAQMRQRGRGPQIEEIVLDVFGFSRGAAAARSFLNQLLRHFSPNGQFLCGVPLRIRFVGLFDTVASVGLADAVPGPFEGHQGWADQDLLPIPPQVEQCVHFVAGHEGRKAFPVDLVLGKDGAYPANCIEVVYPGVHSDVGGGYGPGDQGKALHDQSQLLSQVALRDMYDRALKAGVPLRRPEKLDRAGLKEEFAVNPAMYTSYEAYVRFVQTKCAGKPAIRQYEAHLRQYLHWRRDVLSPARYREQPCVNRSRAQDRTNLVESNDELRRYIEQLKRDEQTLERYQAVQGGGLAPRTTVPAVDLEGLGYYRKYWKLEFLSDRKVHDFLEWFVHDSRAGFTLVDPVSQHDHKRIHEGLEAADKRYQDALRTGTAPPGGRYGAAKVGALPAMDPLTRRQRESLAIYRKKPKGAAVYSEVPVYDDHHPGTWDDAGLQITDGVAAVHGRREGGWSYLHPRQHFAYARLKF